jgi:hypothetical protein
MSGAKGARHVIWLQKWEAGKFLGWLEVGQSRIEVDSEGKARAYSRQALIPIGGWNGLTCTLPIGEKPKDPESIPKRPGDPLEREESHRSEDVSEADVP